MRPIPPPISLHRQRGFTLVEAIIVIMLTGIIASVVSVFIHGAVKSYIDTARRAELTDIADTATRRIARDIQGALPNSARVSGCASPGSIAGTGSQCSFLEIVPIKAAGRYRAEVGTNVADDPLDFSDATDKSFDVLVDTNEPTLNVANGDYIVIFNLGQAGADVYDGSNMRAFSSYDAVKNNMVLTSGAFPFASPDNRFQVVNAAVSYVCDQVNGRLMRYSGYAIQNAQPVDMAAAPLSNIGTTAAVLATSVSACSMAYDSGVLESNGLVTIQLSISQQGETVRMVHQVDVVNTP